MNQKISLDINMTDYLWHLLLSCCLEQKHYMRRWLLYSLKPQIFSVWQTQDFCQEFKYFNRNEIVELQIRGTWRNLRTGPAESLQSSARSEKFSSWGRRTGCIIICWNQPGSYSRCQPTYKAIVYFHHNQGKLHNLGYIRRNRGSRDGEDTVFCAALVRLQVENFIQLWTPAPRRIRRLWRGSSNRLLTWPGAYSVWPTRRAK